MSRLKMSSATLVTTVTLALAILVPVMAGGLLYTLLRLDSIATDNHRDNARTLSALCTFRNDLTTRATQGQAFLNQHPKGFLGIPAAQLQQSINNQQSTITALAILPCEGR